MRKASQNQYFQGFQGFLDFI